MNGLQERQCENIQNIYLQDRVSEETCTDCTPKQILLGAVVGEWLSSWLAEQEDRGSIPGLATWIFRDWLSPASKSRYGWKIAKSTLILKTTTTITRIPLLNAVADSEGAEGTFAPSLKSAKKSVLISPFPHIWWLKMQNFLGSLRSPALFNIILNIALLKNLENNTCSYTLSSFYMVATGEGNFDMKMQDFWTLNSLNCRSFRLASPPPGHPTRAPPWTWLGI